MGNLLLAAWVAFWTMQLISIFVQRRKEKHLRRLYEQMPRYEPPVYYTIRTDLIWDLMNSQPADREATMHKIRQRNTADRIKLMIHNGRLKQAEINPEDGLPL